MNLFTKQKLSHRRRKQTYSYQGREGKGKGGINWEIGIDIYTLLYIKQITNKNVLYSTGNSFQCSVMTSMGMESRREWIYVYVWLIHFAVQQKLTQHCKSTILQLKN